MKSLLLKDYYGSCQMNRSILAVAAFIVIFSCVTKNNTYSLMMAMIFNVNILLNIMNIDDKGGWDYVLSGPISRKQVVLEKYIYCMLSQMIMILAGVLIGAGVTIWYGLSWQDLGYMAFAMAAMAFYVNGIMLPLTFWIGAEKARYVILAVFLIPMILIFTGFMIIRGRENQPMDAFIGYPVMALILAALALFWFFSYFVSLRIFRRKEIGI